MAIIERFATKSPCWKTNLQQQALPSEKQDQRYREFYETTKPDLMLHSLGCARASADYQSDRWNQPTNDSAIAHAVIDSNDGNTRQNLRWDMRGWHCGNPGNNRCIGIEMCESDQITYDDPKKAWIFHFKNKEVAQQHCRTAYQGAVELFADLCIMFELDPLVNILSHKEGHTRGIASNHGDPEHYWDQMGLGYTMNGFRQDVKERMEATSATPPSPTPAPDPLLPFTDVPADAWYADALRWAVEHKIVLPQSVPFYPDRPLDKASAIVLLRRTYNSLKKELDEG